MTVGSVLTLITLLGWTQSINAVQRIVLGPTNTTVRLNELAVLKCRVEQQKGAVQWTRNGFGLGTSRGMEHYARYTMTGRASDGEYNLEIQNATIEDDGAYECQLLWGDQDNPSEVSSVAYLSVVATPEGPVLEGENRETVKANEDTMVRMKCVVKNGRPAAKIAWVVAMDKKAERITAFLNNASELLRPEHVRVQKAYTVHSSDNEQLGSDGFYTTISEIDFAPTKDDDNRYIVCLASHPTFNGKLRTASAALSVRYKPKVRVQLDEEASNLREGGRAVFKCLVDAKPNRDLTVNWQGYGDRLKAIDSQTAVVSDLKMEDHMAPIACVAKNSVGSTRAAINLTVHFRPRIMSTSQIRVVERGEAVTFHCEAVGNPKPEISWRKVGSDATEHAMNKGNSLTLDSVHSWHVGEYECEASIKGFPTSKLSHYLHLKGPPVVKVVEPVYGKTTIWLKCEVRSKPSPNKVVWQFNGKDINYNIEEGRINLEEVQRDYGFESKLTIHHVKPRDYGHYNCTAWNELGHDSSVINIVEQTLEIRIKKTLRYAMSQVPWYAWMAAMLLLFFLALYCCLRTCCCCRRKKNCCPRGSEAIKPAKFSDCSDVTVRCEPLDADAQQYFTDMFSASPQFDSGSELIHHKDYISLPQNNPDLDYLPPPVYGSYYHAGAFNGPADYTANDRSHYDTNFSTYNPVSVRHLNVAPLETLPEVLTPDNDNGAFLNDGERAVSRVSTHV
ncbi:Irregular chiasm C-roughest protein [Aphelenchoides besseyi]|nr:Irregular chiasm C-roughest protein [Aphelenchoides besseyi]